MRPIFSVPEPVPPPTLYDDIHHAAPPKPDPGFGSLAAPPPYAHVDPRDGEGDLVAVSSLPPLYHPLFPLKYFNRIQSDCFQLVRVTHTH